MNTLMIFVDEFIKRTTGSKASFKINELTLDAVKIVLRNRQISYTEPGAYEDCENGYLRNERVSGYYGGQDGFAPTAKGFRRILAELKKKGV